MLQAALQLPGREVNSLERGHKPSLAPGSFSGFAGAFQYVQLLEAIESPIRFRFQNEGYVDGVSP